jgi:type I restriction enzyme S subunit
MSFDNRSNKLLIHSNERQISYLNWEEMSISDVCDSIVDCVNKTAPTVDNATLYKMIRTTNVKNGNIDLASVKYVSEDVYKKWTRRSIPQIGDVILTREAPIGEVGIVKTEDKIFLGQRLIQFRANPKILNSRFLLYSMKSPFMQRQIQLYEGTGSTVSHIRVPDCLKFKIRVPEIYIQNKVVNILGSIDDKIELNNRMNKVLEQMAQTIFKQWFVDFEFLNENGEPYKSSGGEMEWCEELKREIPLGWRVGSLGEVIINFDKKRIPISKNEREKRAKIYPYYGAASIADYVDDYLFDGIYLLLGEDGTVVDNVGYPILQYVWGKFWVNNHAHVLRGKDGYSNEYVYLLLKGTSVQSAVTGAVQLKINQGNLNSIRITIPDINVVKQFSAIIDCFFEKYRVNSEKNQRLSTLRDTLLPKLMSGEIDVKQVEL